jgi:hypothetical protein
VTPQTVVVSPTSSADLPPTFLRRQDESDDAAFYRDPVTTRRTPDPRTGYRGDPLFAVVATRRPDNARTLAG